MPVLGICLGCQVMNVARGGTLHQHLPDLPPPTDAPALLHSRPGDRTNAHPLAIQPDTLLASILPDTAPLDANSRHHQAIDQIPPGLRISARAPDGTIEAIEDPAYPFWLAVQWHPENLAGSPHERLFQALVLAAAAYRQTVTPAPVPVP
jgi:putative glutamine amidotransferase